MSENINGFKLAAIDLDGTLLGPDHAISDANTLAVRRLQAVGVQVVLASGRHFNAMRKYVAELGGVQWVVSCQGGEVSSADRTTVLNRQFLTAPEVEQTLESGRSRGFSAVAYGVEGVFTDSTSDFEMDFYTELVGTRPVVLDRRDLLARDIFKVIWMAEQADLSRVVLAEVASPTVQVVRTNARFLGIYAGGCFQRACSRNTGFTARDSTVGGDGVRRRGQ